jgi:outer membrane immunogenic protein
MKRILLLGVSTLALVTIAATSAAVAADLPARMPMKGPAYVPMFTWTGFYVGGNFGWGWADGNADTVLGGVPGTLSGSGNGALGGVQAGYNWQAGSIVYGVETDIQASGGSGDFNGTNGAVTTTGTSRVPWFGTFRGRIGYAPGRWMVYVTGGGAYGSTHIEGTESTGVAFDSRETYLTYTVGGGIETALWDRWTAKLEYLYVGSPNRVPVPTGVSSISGHTNTDIVRVGLNYHF